MTSISSGPFDNFDSTFALPNNTIKHHMSHFSLLPNEPISAFTPYSGLIITIWFVILFAVKNWLLEKFIAPRFYKKTIASLDDHNRRGFYVHHVSAGVKICLLVVGCKPWSQVIFGKSALHDTLSASQKHLHPTMGDILLFLTQLFVALYVFELFARAKVSWICALHHIAAIMIGQSAVVLSLDLTRQQNATLEYVLCLVWAAFDVLSELWLNIAFIIYRVKPDRHNLLLWVFAATAMANICGTIAETIMIFTLFGQSWSLWELEFKILTPILHVLFTIAQLHCARVLIAMYQKQRKIIALESRKALDTEAQPTLESDAHSNNATSESDENKSSVSVVIQESDPIALPQHQAPLSKRVRIPLIGYFSSRKRS